MAESDWVDDTDWEDEPAPQVVRSRLVQQKPRVGPKETFVNSATDAIPLGRPAVNVTSTLGLQLLKALGVASPGAELTEKAKAEMAERGIPVPENKDAIPGFLETYRQTRDERARRIDAGSEQNPLESGLGTGFGLALSLGAPAAGVAKGAGWVGRLGAAGKTAAAYGGLHGATHGRADLTRGEVGQFVNDVVGVDGVADAYGKASQGRLGQALLALSGAGAVGGGLSGLAVGGAVEGVRKTGTETLRALGIRKAKDVIQGGSDIAAATRKPLSDEAAEAALNLPEGLGDTTEKAYRNLEAAAASEGAEYRRIVEALEAEGVRGPEAKAVADKLMERFREEWAMSPANKAVPNAYADEAANIIELTKPPPGVQGPHHPNLKLGQSEGLKQRLQTQARFERLNNNPAEEARQEISSIVRQANEDAIAQAAAKSAPGSKISELASEFVPTKQYLGKLLEARTAAERGVAKAAQRSSGPGLTDHLLGATTGNPATAYLTAITSKALRNRMPSMAARYSYGLARALRDGSASPTAAKSLMLLLNGAQEDERTESSPGLPLLGLASP